MSGLSRRQLLATTLVLAACGPRAPHVGGGDEEFVCPPCGCAEDDTVFDRPGICPDCQMVLMPSAENALGFEPGRLRAKAGSFQVAAGQGQHTVDVHYYLPEHVTRESNVLLILPGAGRNGDDYRNAWIETAQQHSLIIAAISYPEAHYDLAAYNFGGVVKNFHAKEMDTSTRGVIRVKDEDVRFEVNSNRGEWLFNDFERVFDLIKRATGTTTATYDLFGHSAGAQALHRMVLFQQKSRARKIVAANAGWYTLPNLHVPLPTGLQNAPLEATDLQRALSTDLTILLGELDNSEQAGGTLLRSPIIDQQGQGRLARGQTFYQTGLETAAKLGAPFNWTLATVPNVGHNYYAMSQAAAEILLR